MKKVLGWIYIISLIGQIFSAEIIRANNNTFIKNDDIGVTLYKKNVVESRTFTFSRESFHIETPQQIFNITDVIMKDKCLQFSDQMITTANANIDNAFSSSCSSNTAGRQKRLVPLLIVGGAILILAVAALFAKNHFELKSMRQELENIKTALQSLQKLNEDEAALTSYKFEIQNYVKRHQEATIDIIKTFAGGRTITIDEIPDFLLKYFNLKIGKNQFIFLKMEKCHINGFELYVTVAETLMSEKIFCNKFIHSGFFEAQFYRQYKLPDILCYFNNTCQAIPEKNCISKLNNLKCTNDVFEICVCEVNEINTCAVKTQLSYDNFIHFEQIGNVISIATTSPIYTVVRQNGKTTTTTPKSGIFSVVLNTEERIELGGTVIHGTSNHPTFIAHVIDDDFVLPTTAKHVDFEFEKYDGKQILNDYGALIVLFIVALVLLMVVFFVLKSCFK